MQDDEWLRCVRPEPGARVRLLCVPHAGAGPAAFHPWRPHLPPGVELWAVLLPGRETRLMEPPVGELALLLPQLCAAVARWRRASALPYVLLGHSLGALLGYELARHLSATGAGPERLVVSGHGAPHLPSTERLHLLPDEEFAARVREESAGHDALADPALRELLLPALRADFRLAETYAPTAGPALRCPVTTWAGAEDPGVPAEEIEQWAGYTTGRARHLLFPGGHLFPLDDPAAVLAALAEDLAGLLAASSVTGG
ncbi:thioesterase II family protein [Kitasatospora sp. NPDC004531]